MSFSCPVLKLCFYICQRQCAFPTPVRNRPKKNSIQRKRGGLHTVSRIKCRYCTFLQATDTLSLEFPYQHFYNMWHIMFRLYGQHMSWLIRRRMVMVWNRDQASPLFLNRHFTAVIVNYIFSKTWGHFLSVFVATKPGYLSQNMIFS